MPIYEYQCPDCGKHCDLLQKVSDPALTECPHCHKTHLKKLVSAPSFQLKGTGWYVTDFRDPKKPAKSDQKDTSSKDNKTDTPSSTTEKD